MFNSFCWSSEDICYLRGGFSKFVFRVYELVSLLVRQTLFGRGTTGVFANTKVVVSCGKLHNFLSGEPILDVVHGGGGTSPWFSLSPAETGHPRVGRCRSVSTES